MPLHLRGSYATERHAFSYFTSSPTLDAVAPCGSNSVFEVTQSVYKYAPNRLSFRLRNSLMLVMMAIAVIVTITVVIVTVATAIFVVTIIIAVVVIMLG